MLPNISCQRCVHHSLLLSGFGSHFPSSEPCHIRISRCSPYPRVPRLLLVSAFRIIMHLITRVLQLPPQKISYRLNPGTVPTSSTNNGYYVTTTTNNAPGSTTATPGSWGDAGAANPSNGNVGYNGEGETRSASEGDTEQTQKIYETLHFDTLWRLSDALNVTEQKSPLEHVATVLLPLIETLMAVSKHLGPKAQAPQSPRAAETPLSPKTPVIGFTSAMARAVCDDLFVAFTDSHRKLLDMMVRNNPSLMSGSFTLLVNNPKVLDFDDKRNYFSQQLQRRPQP